eukprot:TRINITY_DN67486_c1_g1_i2.p2 TRINITY_DN67486_c1_g1~~TRINITY_DN67486_c1_g1_i2.p2  ORF type:complete len:101 (+),score=0.21 TRINITY_DN67486_c1_g1_i2:35-304(+)
MHRNRVHVCVPMSAFAKANNRVQQVEVKVMDNGNCFDWNAGVPATQFTCTNPTTENNVEDPSSGDQFVRTTQMPPETLTQIGNRKPVFS